MDALQHVAAPYLALLEQCKVVCCESTETPLTELHLQTLWQHKTLRPKALTLVDGTPVEILEVGRWNRADGPDFQDALITIGGIPRRGDVELHLTPKDWDLHRHTENPAYGNVILHVTWQTTPPARTLPPGIPSLALQPFLPQFDPASLDLNGIPYQPLDQGRPCLQRLKVTPGALTSLLSSAGYFRLLTKTRRYAEGLHAADPFQCFYEGLFTAMGYQRNTAPFRRLAQEVPFARIAGFSSAQRFAALAGVAGLLKKTHRELWDLWWQSGLQPPLTAYTWDLRGTRPQNHPFRRLAGAVGILDQINPLLEMSLDELPEALSKASNTLRECIQSKSALVGLSRANAVLLNLFVPYRLALGSLHPDHLKNLPGEDVSMPMRETWHRLTGTLRGLPKDGLRQQGLLQIYNDFCHNPRLTCATCPIG